MKTIQEPIIGGFFATLALLLVSFIENISGSFNYISPIFLSSIADDSILGAFFLQLIAGWIFAFIYSLFFIKILSWAKNDWIRGLIYGIVIAILMEIGLYIAVDNIILPNLILDTIGMLIDYGIFGIVLGAFIPLSKREK